MADDRLAAALEESHSKEVTNLEGFKTLLRFPSISLDPAFLPPLQACADWILAEMRLIGLENCQKLSTAGNPILYGDWLHAGADSSDHSLLRPLRRAAGRETRHFGKHRPLSQRWSTIG